MRHKENNIILAGNGPYLNRGCEAIVRGTKTILEKYFPQEQVISASFLRDEEVFKKHLAIESDPDIKNIGLIPYSKMSLEFIYKGIRGRINPSYKRFRKFSPIKPYLPKTKAVLSVGGDNYSLDYGIPQRFLDLDDYAKTNNIPLIIWGASVGPFSKNPTFEKRMVKHLQSLTGIFARESFTVKYLEELGIEDNVYRVADPAFLLKPTYLEGFNILPQSIGINLSPLVATFAEQDQASYLNHIVSLIRIILKKFDHQILLIPHVLVNHSNDFLFMKRVWDLLGNEKERVTLIPPTFNASQTKWIISQCQAFIGARTHATIAAFSSNVPTISLSYSIKAEGLNQDIYGHQNFCIAPKDFSSSYVCEVLQTILSEKEEIRKHLEKEIPKQMKLAMKGGAILKDLLSNS